MKKVNYTHTAEELEQMNEATRVDCTRVKPIRFTLRYAGRPLLSQGHISFLHGMPKTGKSTLANVMTAAALAGHYQLLATHNGKPLKKVIYFDTEHSEGNAYENCVRILEMAGIDPSTANTDNFDYCRLGPLDYDKALQFVLYAIEKFKPELVVIDNIADLVRSVNIEVVARKLVRTLQDMAIDTGCHILATIHDSYASQNKARGHLGSELDYRTDTEMLITHDQGSDLFKVFTNNHHDMYRFKFTLDEKHNFSFQES